MANFSRFYALLNQMPQADKKQLVFDASGGRTDSLKMFFEMDYRNYNRLLDDMQRAVDKITPPTSPKGRLGFSPLEGVEETEKRRYRSMILAKLNERGIVVKNWDYSEVNGILQHWTRNDKTMKTMSLDELKKLSRQVHKIMDWYDKQKEQLHKLTKLN